VAVYHQPLEAKAIERDYKLIVDGIIDGLSNQFELGTFTTRKKTFKRGISLQLSK
jgi:hypothetical protein